ncbi:MAG: hypothetical protein ACFFD4_28725, partial [Candidatus Odinarchaeota archaeon]
MRKNLRLLTVIMISVLSITTMQPAVQPVESHHTFEPSGYFYFDNVKHGPATVYEGQTVTLYCDLFLLRRMFDLNIDFYWKATTESTWHVKSTFVGDVVGNGFIYDYYATYSANIGSFSAGQVIEYYFYGIGWSENWGFRVDLFNRNPASGSLSFTVYDITPPEITSIKELPYYPTSTSGATISAEVTDNTAVSSVFLYWNVYGSSFSYATEMTKLTGNVYSAHLALGSYNTWWYKIVATDQYGNVAESSTHIFFTYSDTYPDTGWYSYIHENRAGNGPLKLHVNHVPQVYNPFTGYYSPPFNWNADYVSGHGVYQEFSSDGWFRVSSNAYGLIKRVPISSSLVSGGTAQLRMDINLDYYPSAERTGYEKWKIHIVDEIVASGSSYSFNPLASTGDITGAKDTWNNGAFSLSFDTSGVTGNDVYVMLEMDEVYDFIGLKAAINTINTIAVETTPPVIEITSPDNGQIIKHVAGGTDVSYTYTVTDVNTYTVTVKLNGQVIANDGTLDNLGIGHHTLKIEALDAAGNLGSKQIQFWVAPEAITNGGFESGSENWIGSGIITSGIGHTGSYGCSLLTSIPDTFMGIPLGYDYYYYYKRQVLDSNTVVVTDNVLSFSFWAIHPGTDVEVTVQYSNGPSTVRLFGSSSSYVKHVITGLPAEKRITEVKFRGTGPSGGISNRNIYIDDISLLYLPYDDNKNPVVQIASPFNGQVFAYTPGGTDVPYTYAVTELNNYDVKVKLNGQVITDDGLLENLAPGTYTLRVEALDAAENLGYKQVQFSVVDESPVITVSPPNYIEVIQGSSRVLSWTATDLYPDVFTVTRDGNPVRWGSWTSGVPVEVPVDTSQLGTYIYEIEFLDISGNPATDQVTVKIIDTTPPAVSNPPDFTRELGTPVTVQWTVTDTNPGVYSLTVNGIRLITDKPWTSGLITETIPDQLLIRGPNTITAKFKDSSGNSNSDTVTVFIVDTTLPWITVPQPDKILDSNSAFVLSWTAEDLDPDVYEVYREGPDGDKIKIQSGPWQSGVAITVSEDALPPGVYLYQIYISDGTGNTAMHAVEVTVNDVNPPVVVINYPGDYSWFEYGTTVAYGYTVTDESDYTVTVKLNGAIMPDTNQLENLAVGDYTLEVNATDVHGNTAIASIIFYVRDTIPPEVAITSPANGETFEYTAGGSTVSYSYTASDASSYTVTVKLNGAIMPDTNQLENLAVGD